MKYFVAIAALFLHLNAQEINSQLIRNEQFLLFQYYQLDPSFLNNFPFSTYKIVNSAYQGKFYIDRQDHIKRTLTANKIWEPEIVDLLQKYVKPNTIAVDIGAHIGTHTMTMARCVEKDGVVIAFEPQAKLHRELIMNLQLNQHENVIPVHAALGAHEGIAYLEPLRPDNEGYRSLSARRPTEKVSLTTLDSFQLTSVSCMKIDVESYEWEVLQGAYNTIMHNRPVILIEIGGGWSREREQKIDPKTYLAAIIDLLENTFHYDVTAISTTTGDYLAIPKEII